jgi:hypothetical protein
VKPLSDCRIRGQTNGYAGPSAFSITHDPACLVTCSSCMETVIAARRRYYDDLGVEHRHQPHLAHESYGEFHVKPHQRGGLSVD